VDALYGDVGPNGEIGEISIALAAALCIPSSPRNGGGPDGVTFTVSAALAFILGTVFMLAFTTLKAEYDVLRVL